MHGSTAVMSLCAEPPTASKLADIYLVLHMRSAELETPERQTLIIVFTLTWMTSSERRWLMNSNQFQKMSVLTSGETADSRIYSGLWCDLWKLQRNKTHPLWGYFSFTFIHSSNPTSALTPSAPCLVPSCFPLLLWNTLCPVFLLMLTGLWTVVKSFMLCSVSSLHRNSIYS